MSTHVKTVVRKDCDICPTDDVDHNNPPRLAVYDFKTQFGPWANGCEAHYQSHRLYDSLGTGKGQKYVSTCGHDFYGDTIWCAEMSCENYVNKHA